MITPIPARATAAPAYPPISACEELVGNPKYHVIRSHTIAPMRPPKITAGVTAEMSIIPLPIVFATAVPTVNASSQLKTAAQVTACSGEQPRGDPTVSTDLLAPRH